MIRLDNISLGYTNRTLIDSLSADVEQGQITALVGRNGTGKSTLLRTIAGLAEPLKGEIELQGKRLSTLSTAELATTISFVTTDKVRISNLRCRDVVALGRAPYTNWIGRMQDEDRP